MNHLNTLRIGTAAYLLTAIISLGAFAQPQGPTEILILGTPHLQQVKGADHAMLSSLLKKLEAFNFDAIAVEGMETELLYDIRSRKDTNFDQVIQSYGGMRLTIADSMQQAMGMSFQVLQGKADALIARPSLTDEERTELITYLLATGDIASAAVHYGSLTDNSHLPEHLSLDLIETLEHRTEAINETYALGVQLARQEGIQRLHAIDDLQDEPLLFKHFDQFVPDYMANQDFFKEVMKHPSFHTSDSIQKASVEQGDLLPLYLYLNSPAFKQNDAEAQWDIWFESNFPSGSDRSRHALWEMRNLMISARIMKAAAFHPGERMLVIIGASHVSFLEKYLRHTGGIELLSLDSSLGAPE